MVKDHTPSRLFTQLVEANVSDDEIAELFEDLKYIFESNEFDSAVAEAVTIRGCQYIEAPEQRPN